MESKIEASKSVLSEAQETLFLRTNDALTQFWLADDELKSIQRLLDDEGVAGEFSFSYTSQSTKIENLADRSSEFHKHVGNLYEDVYNEIDKLFLEDMEKFTSAVAKISIDKHPVKNSAGLSVQGTTWQAGVSISAPSTPVTTFTKPDKMTFSDLMNTAMTREMKQQQYQMFLEMNNLVDMDYSYENFINNLYRRSEFGYQTRAGKIEGVLTTGATIILMLGTIVLTGGMATGVAIPSIVGQTMTVVGGSVTLYNGYKLMSGKDVDGNKLSEVERQQLMGSVTVDVAFMIAGWGLNKIIKNANKVMDESVDVVKDVGEANNVKNGASVEKASGAGGTGNGANNPKNVALHEKYKDVLKTTQDANPLVDSLRETGKLPDNFINKEAAELAGWRPGKALENYVPDAQLGGDIFKNNPPILPEAPGRIWYEADVGLSGSMSRAKQPGTRLVYSNDGLMYITTDHYGTVHSIGNYLK